MLVIILKDLPQEFMFAVMDGFDDVFVVSREVEKASAFARGPEFGEYILAGQGHKVVSRVEAEEGSEMTKDPGCVVLKLEVVFC